MTAAAPVVPSVIASRYRVLRELGRGGMGAVYLVEHLHTGEQFALKVLLAHCGASPELIERFKRESRAPARIKSDHVAKVIDADVAAELGGAPFLVMELLEGSNLEDHINASGPLSVDETLDILRQLAVALDRAHAIGIVHRDLKPENVFLHRREGHRVVKLLDFGISKLTDEGGGNIRQASLTKTGAMMGTPLYMSPEQARGETKIGPTTDVWALGLIAFRMLTTAIYWDAETIAVLMSQIVAMPMRPASTRARVPPSFDRWFARSCDRDASQRFASVGEQVEALAAAFSEPHARSSMLMTNQPITHPLPRTIQSATTPMPPGRPSAQPVSEATSPPNAAFFGAGTNAGMAHTKLGAAPNAPNAPNAPRGSLTPWVALGASGIVVVVLLAGAALFAQSSHKHREAQGADASSGSVLASQRTAEPSAAPPPESGSAVLPGGPDGAASPGASSAIAMPLPSAAPLAAEKAPRGTKVVTVAAPPVRAEGAPPAVAAPVVTAASAAPVVHPPVQPRPVNPATTFAPTAL
jgi:serine/threonine-protein kinase